MSKPEAIKPRAKTRFNYGVHGWLLMIYGVIGFMTAASFWTSTAQNTAVGILAQQTGVESSTLLYWCSVAGVLSVIVMLFVGMLFSKFKTRKMVCGHIKSKSINYSKIWWLKSKRIQI